MKTALKNVNNLTNILAALEAAGVRYECYTNIVIDRSGYIHAEETVIGINIHEWIWAWFTYVNFETSSGEHYEYFSFKQRYSQITGKASKGWSCGFKIQQRITKKTGFIFN